MTKRVKAKPLALKLVERAIEQNRKVEERRPVLLDAMQKVDQIGKIFNTSYRAADFQAIADEWHSHNLIAEALEIARQVMTGELELVEAEAKPETTLPSSN